MSRLKEPSTWAGVSGAAAALASRADFEHLRASRVAAMYLREQSGTGTASADATADHK